MNPALDLRSYLRLRAKYSLRHKYYRHFFFICITVGVYIGRVYTLMTLEAQQEQHVNAMFTGWMYSQCSFLFKWRLTRVGESGTKWDERRVGHVQRNSLTDLPSCRSGAACFMDRPPGTSAGNIPPCINAEIEGREEEAGMLARHRPRVQMIDSKQHKRVNKNKSPIRLSESGCSSPIDRRIECESKTTVYRCSFLRAE